VEILVTIANFVEPNQSPYFVQIVKMLRIIHKSKKNHFIHFSLLLNIWAFKAPAPGRPPGVFFYISENNLHFQTKNALASNLYLSCNFQLPLHIMEKSWLFMTGF